jgi:hypothetical protein
MLWKYFNNRCNRLAFCALALCWTVATRTASAESYWAHDKAAHFSASYGLSLSTTLILRKTELPRWLSVVIGCGGTLLLGTMKELVVDDGYSWGDQAANGAGAMTSAIFTFTFEL